MNSRIILVICAVQLRCSYAFPAGTNEAVAKDYLQRFGYYVGLPEARASVAPADVEKAEISLAISQFQLLNGLAVTGRLDDETMRLMGKPRCGVADIRPLAKDATDYRWEKDTLTWALEKNTRHVEEGATRLALREALEAWRPHMANGMDFVEFPAGADVDLAVQFGTRQHGDPWPFDGKGLVLAHALYPPSGKVHFDDDEKWVYRDEQQFAQDRSSTDMLQVAMHEFGHALGLPHSQQLDAVMAPFYPEVSLADGYYKAPRLSKDDIEQIKKLYGGDKRRDRSPSPITLIPTRPTTTTSTTTPRSSRTAPTTSTRATSTMRPVADDPHTACPQYVDAAVHSVSTSQSYIFADKFMWDYDGGHLRNRRPIADVFPGGPDRVTAASSTPWNQFTTLINERLVYNFYMQPSDGRAQLKSGPMELPKKVPFTPAIACIRHDGNQMLIQGGEMATYDEGRNTATFVGALQPHMDNFPADATACLPQSGRNDGMMVVFAPGRYYVYDSRRQAVLPGYPRPLSQLLKC